MNPNAGQNPYLQVLARMQQGQSAGLPGGPSARPGAAPAMGGPAAAMMGGTPGGAPQPAGKNGNGNGNGAPQGTTRFLLSALQALQQAMLQIPDPQEQALVRSVVVLLSGLIQKDQQRLSQPQAQAPAPQGLMGR